MANIKRKTIVALIQVMLLIINLRIAVVVLNGIAVWLVDDGTPHQFGIIAPMALVATVIIWCMATMWAVLAVGKKWGNEHEMD